MEEPKTVRMKIEGKEHDYWVYGYGAIIIMAKDGFPESHISRFDLDELEMIVKKAKEQFEIFKKSDIQLPNK